MRQGWMRCAGAVALAMLVASAPIAAHAAKGAAPKSEGRSTASRTTYRQFTGWVTAMDKTSITVEKRGSKPETKVFARDDEMRSTGDVVKDAHVTVYFRDDGGRAVAHKVVVKKNAARGDSR